MNDWLGNFGQPSIKTTYGKKTSGPVFSSLNTNLSSPDADSPARNHGQTNYSKKQQLKPISSNIVKNSDAVEKKRLEKRKGMECTLPLERKMTKSKVDMKEMINRAHPDDLNCLYEELKRFEEKPQGEVAFSGLRVMAPSAWVPKDKSRLEAWLDSIGFECKTVHHSNKLFFTYSYDKVPELRSYVLGVYSKSEISKSIQALETVASSSAPESQEPVRIFTSNGIPLTVCTKSQFRDFRSDDFSEDSSIAGSPYLSSRQASPRLFSPTAAAAINFQRGGYILQRGASERSNSLFSVESAGGDRIECSAMDKDEIEINAEMTKLDLHRRGSTASLASSVSPTEALLEDDDEEDADDDKSDGSLSTIEDEISTIRMESDVAIPGITDTSLDSQSMQCDPHPTAPFHVSSPVEALKAATQKMRSAFETDVTTDVSFPHGTRQPRGRLRRSKSAPVPCTSTLRVSELTPGKSFSQDPMHTATPLRLDIPKLFSGRDITCDWGSSQPACAESIDHLRDLHSRHRSNTTGGINMSCHSTGQRSPAAMKRPSFDSVNGSLLASPQNGAMTPFDAALKVPLFPLPTGTPSFASLKCMTPMFNSLQHVMRTPMSMLAISHMRSAEQEVVVSEDSITNARRAVQNMCPLSPQNTSADTEAAFPSAQDREKSKFKKSNSKWRRVSMGLNSSLNLSARDTSLSPAAVTKCNSKVLSNRRLSMSHDTMDISMGQHSVSLAYETTVTHFNLRVRDRIENLCLSEQNFKGVIIGGTYQSCFECGLPVVAASSSTEKRVATVRVAEDGFELDMYIAKDRTLRTVRLGPRWCSMRTSPDGYLVFKECSVITKKFICYYIPNDPLDWIREERRLSSPKKVKFLVDTPLDLSAAIYSYRNEMDCSNTSMIREEEGADEIDNMSTESTNNLSSSASYEEFEFRMTDDTQAALVESDVRPVADWYNSTVVALVLEFLVGMNRDSAKPLGRKKNPAATKFVSSVPLESHPYRLVCKDWAIGYYRLLARTLSDPKALAIKDYNAWADFVRKYERGKFLSRGACKEVFELHRHDQTLEAVSIMDVNDLQARDMDLAISKEIEISMLCSSLLDLNICPNLVKVHSIFQALYNAPDDLWRKPQIRQLLPSVLPLALPKAHQLQRERGKFQYIRMEFCKGGDVEGLVRKERQLPITTVRSMLFQMLYGLYTCREKFALRHFDIKLLNFFCTHGGSLLPDFKPVSKVSSPFSSVFTKEKPLIHLNIGFGDKVFAIPVRQEEYDLIKLADFGTSVIGAGTLGDPIGVNQFTTLENTPIEYLLLGSEARQAYSADTFCLGLSFFHLLTGLEPYEELLKEVKCPSYLKDQLKVIWETTDESSPYYVINEVIDSLEDDDDNELHSVKDVLYDTLYRYIVLFGIPRDFYEDGYDMPWKSNLVWNSLVDALGLVGGRRDLFSKPPTGRKGKSKRLEAVKNASPDACLQDFARDSEQWNFDIGTHPVIRSARERLGTLSGGTEVFYRMIHYDPSRRCSAKEALLSPLFKQLERVEGTQPSLTIAPPPLCFNAKFNNNNKHPQPYDLHYLHYYRSPANGGMHALPFM